MGVIFELVRLPKKEKKKFLEKIVHQETTEKLKSKKIHDLKVQTGK